MAHKNYLWKKIGRYLPLALIALGMIVFYLLVGFDWLNFEVLREQHGILKRWSEHHPGSSALLFILIYAISVALSVPGAAILSILGGFLFPQPLSTLYVVIGATLGASALFAAAKTALKVQLKKRAGPRLSRLRKGFRKGQVSYMFFLRLVPIVPFWLVNLAAAFFGTSFITFLWTTFVGIIPGAFLFTQAGRGLASILEAHEFSLSSVLNFHVQLSLSALGIFALLPLVVKWVQRRKKRRK